LDELAEIKIGIYYKLNGVRISRYPADDAELRQVEVEYETLPGWQQSIAEVRTWEELPENAKKYILRIQDHLQIPVRWVGVGQGRDAVINLPGKA